MDDENIGVSRLDNIYAELRELQSFKDEIMDDLDDFMDEVQSNKDVAIPKQFD